MNITIAEVCPLCRRVEFVGWRFDLRQCTHCALVVSPSVWGVDPDEAANEVYFGRVDHRSRWVDRFEARKNRSALRRIAAAGAANAGKLLEVGVGSGSFLAAARADGYKVFGCDLSATLCERVQRELRIPMYHGSPADVVPPEPFDVVIANHVLEHVRDPIDFLKAISAQLAAGGMLHVAVPNVACWQALLAGWNSYEPYHHLYFNVETLSECLEKAGFEIQSVDTPDSFSGWFLALGRTVTGVKRAGAQIAGRRSTGWLGEHAYRLAMIAAGFITLPIRMLQSRFRVGDEIIAIARKSAREL